MKNSPPNGMASAKGRYSDGKADKANINGVNPSIIYNIYVLEFSESQQCFHIEALQSMIEGNVQAYLHGRPMILCS